MASQPQGTVTRAVKPQEAWQPTGGLSRRMTRLILATAMISVLIGIVPPAYNFAASYHSDMRARLLKAIGNHEALAKAALDVADAGGVQAAATAIGQDADAGEVRIMDDSGATIAVFRRAEEPKATAPRQMPQWRRVATDYVPEIRFPDLQVRHRLDINGDPLGSVEVKVSSRPIVLAVVQRLQAGLLAVLIVAVFATVVARRMSRQVAMPISRLLDTMDNVAYTQNYALQTKPEGPDEVARLIIGFNEMLKQIHTRNQVLAEHRRKLHDLVVERTRSFERAAREAETASRAKGDFLARMSHEIRTPMNGVVGMAELLENTRLEEQQHNMLKTMRTSADSLLDIINDILDFSRIEAGQLQVLQTWFSPVEVMEDVCDLLASRAHERNVDLVCDIDMGVPEDCGGDPIRLRQIITNLVGNAVKYTEKGRIVLRATATPDGDDRTRLRIEVVDTGLGIPEDKINTIFEAFTQGDTFESRKHGGTGLGLAITKQLVHILDGEIGVTSTLGVGSTFWISLPLSTRPAKGAVQPWKAGIGSALVVQADEAAAAATAALLKSGGVDVYTATTGHRAQDRMALSSYDLILVDDWLPDMAGITLIDHFRKTRASASIPCILLKSSKPAAAEAAANAQVSSQPEAVLSLPLRRLRLHDAVHQALNGGGDEAVPAAPAAASAATGRLDMRVLLVEDSPVNREVAVGMLESLGCSVETAGDGGLGVEHALSWAFDAVMMDCQMPLMDGFEATRRIRAAEAADGRKPMPIIALTANALQGDRERCLSSGMSDFISKPFTIKKLREALLAAARSVADDGSTQVPPEPGEAPVADHGDRELAQVAAPAGAGKDLPIVDLQQIEELRSLGRPQIVRDAVSLFLKHAVENLEGLDDAVRDGSIVDIERRAHALRSSSLSVGGRRFAAAAGDCEQAARSGDAEAAVRLARLLWPEYAALCRRLQSLERPGAVAA